MPIHLYEGFLFGPNTFLSKLRFVCKHHAPFGRSELLEDRKARTAEYIMQVRLQIKSQ